MKYRTIVADPPWPYKDGPTPRQRARGEDSFLPYETMEIDEMTEVLRLVPAAVDAHLYLWTTQRFLFDARAVLESADFMPQHLLVWCKPSNGAGLGGAFAPNVEFCYFARRDWGVSLREACAEADMGADDLCEEVRKGKRTGLVSMWLKGMRYPNETDWEALEELLGEFGPRAGLPVPVESSWFQWPRGRHSEKPDAFYDLVERVSPEPRLELFARRARFGWDYWGDESLGTAELPGAAA